MACVVPLNNAIPERRVHQAADWHVVQEMRQFIKRPCRVSPELFHRGEHETRIVAAEAEAVFHGFADLHGSRLEWDIIQIATRIQVVHIASIGTASIGAVPK